MEVIQKPVALAANKGCNSKGCKKYTCFYRIFGQLGKASYSECIKHSRDINLTMFDIFFLYNSEEMCDENTSNSKKRNVYG